MVKPDPDPDNYPPIDPDEEVPDDPGILSPDTPVTLPPAPVEPMPGPDDPDSVPVQGRLGWCPMSVGSEDDARVSVTLT